MTDEIDLDDLAVESDDEDSNEGDWFWRGEGDPADESAADPVGDRESTVRPDAGTESPDDGSDEDGSGPDPTSDPVPHVPRENKGSPVGIPMDSGGAGGTAAADRDPGENVPEHPDAEDAETTPADVSGPHGGGIDDMTMALTYRAAKRFADPQPVFRQAAMWADWIGIVGDVETYVISSFQRDNGVDVDFFSGSGQGPAERLADIGEHSMFYAERMVVVGLPEEEHVAEDAGWEFVSLSEAAEKADWDLVDDSE